MANIVFSSILTDSEIERCEKIIQRHSHSSAHCRLWTGTKDKDGYGVIRFQFRGKRVKVRVHRLSFYIHSSFSDVRLHNVSHLCHKRNCIRYEHLSLEPISINNKRKNCVLNGECTGHYGYKSCIL